MLSYQGDDELAKLATAWPTQSSNKNWGVWAEGAAQTVSAQGIQSGFVRDFYVSTVESLDPGDAISRTIIKFISRVPNSPISNAFIFEERGSDLGGGGAYWEQLVGISEGSANVTNLDATRIANNARILGSVGLLITLGLDAYQISQSNNPLQSGVERGVGFLGAALVGFAGGTAGSLLGPPGAISGSLVGGALGGQWGRELGEFVFRTLSLSAP
jgi:hypothetical protein